MHFAYRAAGIALIAAGSITGAAAQQRTSTWEPGIVPFAGESRPGYKTESGERCRDACVRDRACTAWSWYTPADETVPKECYLFTARVAKREPAELRRSLISGVVSARGAADAPPGGERPAGDDRADAELRQHCTNPDLADGAIVRNCTLLIDSGRLNRRQLADALNSRGAALVSAEPDRAIADLMRSIELNPTHDGPYHNLGVIFEDRGDFARAAEYYGRAIARAKRPNVSQISRGRALLRGGRYDAAIADFNAILRRDSANAGALYLRGIAKRRKGDASADADLAAAAPRLHPLARDSFQRIGLVP